jgi:hypothetical protein
MAVDPRIIPLPPGECMQQREMMRALVAKYGRDPERVCREYVFAEKRGEVTRRRNKNGVTPEEYARDLYRDGEQNGWLFK